MATGFSSKLRLTSSESALETADGFYRHCECRSGNYLLQSVHRALGEHRQYAERPLCTINRRCRPTDAHACASFKQWLSRNSRSARSASASSKGRSCRHCSDRRKSQAGRNSASRHRTRNNWDWIDIPRAAVAVRQAQSGSFPGVSWKAVIRWLMIARQEAVSVPAWRRPFMNRRSRRDDRQQRQDDSNRQKHEARHQRTIDGRLLRGNSNLGARCSAAASLAKRPLRGRSPQRST